MKYLNTNPASKGPESPSFGRIGINSDQDAAGGLSVRAARAPGKTPGQGPSTSPGRTSCAATKALAHMVSIFPPFDEV